MENQFQLLSARGKTVEELVSNLLVDYEHRSGSADLGFIYITDSVAHEFDQILASLRDKLDVTDWVGTVGLGVCCTGQEYYDEPAAVVLLTSQTSYQLLDFSNIDAVQNNPAVQLNAGELSLAVVHGNPSHAEFAKQFQSLGGSMPTTYFVGGLSSSMTIVPQVLNKITDSYLSGVLFEDSSKFAVSHTQGCSPMHHQFEVTKCKDNIVFEIDQRPALDVFKETVGEVLAKDLNKVAGYIFAGFPIPNSDTNDYLVRNIIGFDLDNAAVLVGDYVSQGQAIMFCRRDGNSAIEDMERMLKNIKSRLTSTPKGALYYSCLARGRNQFGDDSEEMKLIQKHLGDLPVAGFFANGEILHTRLYGYTGVLTVFT